MSLRGTGEQTAGTDLLHQNTAHLPGRGNSAQKWQFDADNQSLCNISLMTTGKYEVRPISQGPLGEVTTALHTDLTLIGHEIMSEWHRLRKWGITVNVQQGVAKRSMHAVSWDKKGGNNVCAGVWQMSYKPFTAIWNMDRYDRKILMYLFKSTENYFTPVTSSCHPLTR